MNRCYFLLIVSLVVIFINPIFIEAWDENATHNRIAEEAVKHSVLSPLPSTKKKGNYLENLGLTQNLGEKFEGKTLNKKKRSIDVINNVEEWIVNGAQVEDRHDLSLMNHFHDPLKNWSDAGLELIPFACSIFVKVPFVGSLTCQGESSLTWAINSENSWSWQNVRNYYADALTSPNLSDRKENFAKTFRGIGQIIHLIQDTSQPAHVRDDPHALDALDFADGFESWARDNSGKAERFMRSPIFPPGLLLTSSSAFPTPITELFDTKQFASQGNFPADANGAGLAEYTNANFFSEDTIFSEYPWPSIDPANAIKISEPPETRSRTTTIRSYFQKKNCCGENNLGAGYLLAAESITEKYVKGSPADIKIVTLLDDKVYEGYASFLFPRAVGYSTALIDYFFRGEMEVTKADDGSFTLKNTSKENMQNGTLQICYDDEATKTRGCDELQVASLVKDASISLKPPVLPEGTLYSMAVYRGQLGSEVNAVIGKALELPSSPPSPPTSTPSDPSLPPVVDPTPPPPEPNLPPVVNDDTAITNNNTSVTINVLSNDFDPDGTIDPSTLLVVSSPTNGVTNVLPSGGIQYRPNLNFVGDDSFVYRVADNIGATGSATVRVTVVNLPPVVVDDTASTNSNESVVINVLGNDSDPDGFIEPSSLLIVSLPSNGLARVSPSGSIEYTPNIDFVGLDSFIYSVADNVGAIGFATVKITVKPLPFVLKIVSEKRFVRASLGPFFIEAPTERSDVILPGEALIPAMVRMIEPLAPNGSSATVEATQDALLGVTPNSISLSGGSFAEWTSAGRNIARFGTSDATILFSVTTPVNYEFSGSVTALFQDQGIVQSFASLLDKNGFGISVHNVFQWMSEPNQTWSETGVLAVGTYMMRAGTSSWSNGVRGIGTARGGFSFSISFSEIK